MGRLYSHRNTHDMIWDQIIWKIWAMGLAIGFMGFPPWPWPISETILELFQQARGPTLRSGSRGRHSPKRLCAWSTSSFTRAVAMACVALVEILMTTWWRLSHPSTKNWNIFWITISRADVKAANQISRYRKMKSPTTNGKLKFKNVFFQHHPFLLVEMLDKLDNSFSLSLLLQTLHGHIASDFSAL